MYSNNRWVSFLRHYGPIPRNDNMYDESIQRTLRRTRIEPLRLDTRFVDTLHQNYLSPRPKSVVLTGTAGDGKTYVCREVWFRLGGDPDVWESNEKIRTLTLPNRHRLSVIKDLSELRDGDYSALQRMAASVVEPDPTEHFLVAANDGQLLEAWSRVPEESSVDTVRNAIESLLVSDGQSTVTVDLLLFNLSRGNTAELFRKVVDAVTTHPDWSECDRCKATQESKHVTCPIIQNRDRLRDPLLLDRLADLLELCDRSGFHLPIRQLLILVSNSILGHPDARDGLLTCREVGQVVRDNALAKGSIYNNIFGANLTRSRRESTAVFEFLGRFGIGEETTNRFDNILVFGREEPGLRKLFNVLVESDLVYGAHPEFTRLQTAYLEGVDPQAAEEFLSELPAQRRRLFFAVPKEMAAEIGLWKLSAFQYAGEYLSLLRDLANGNRAPRAIVGRLVQGANRIFTGLLSKSDQELVLATSGSFSQARISRVQEYSISVPPRGRERVAVELDGGMLELAVKFDDRTRVGFELNLLRYEFLSRVADGALPSSFSRECYEDVLSFKSRLLRAVDTIRAETQDVAADDELTLSLLEVDGRGALVTRPLTLKLRE